MGLSRRTFLQQAGLGLAALGASEALLSLLSDKSLAVSLLDRYFQVLAQPGGRKLALLVGINQYPRSTALGGCITDVELQRELLIHRFGFTPSDILTLTDSKATRENIETAFIEHLSEQAKAGDVVVFHFSGYGSRVRAERETQVADAEGFQNSLVPVDGLIPSKGEPTANDMLEETLTLLLRSLATDHVTTVLDTSHTRAGDVLRGNLRVRSCPKPPAEGPNPGELGFQEQLLLRLNTSWEKLKKQKTLEQMPGVVLAAAGPRQAATEALWNGFSAGLFTYALTQYLWQATPATTVQISLSRASGMVNQWAGQEQQPRLKGQSSLQKPLLAYYLPPAPGMGADGVVTAVEDNGKTAQLWLAGLPATVLEHYGTNSILHLFSTQIMGNLLGADSPEKTPPSEGEQDNQGEAQSNSERVPTTPSNLPKLQLRSKEGLTAKARLLGSNVPEDYQIQVGQLVQEAVRLLPRNLGLTVALDARLERIERVDATSAFSSIPVVSSVVAAGEQPADYLFGKALEESEDSALGGYGLFYLAREPIRNTTGEKGEAVKSAVTRLSPKLKTLLAAKLLRLSANEGSSRLGIRASLERVNGEPSLVMRRETLRSTAVSRTPVQPKIKGEFVEQGCIPKIPKGSRIQYRIENPSDRPIYFMLIGFDTSGSAIALYKIQSFQENAESENKPPLKNAVIEAGETLVIPQSSASFDWVVPGPAGLAEVQLICSHSPFTKAITALEAARRPKGEGERIGDLFNPLEVTKALLQDLHKASAIPEAIAPVSDAYALDVKAWATLSFIYQVV